jgi:hypothetical protein
VYVDLLDSLSENIDLQCNNNGSYLVYFEGSPTYDICIGRNGEECMPCLVESLVSQSFGFMGIIHEDVMIKKICI